MTLSDDIFNALSASFTPKLPAGTPQTTIDAIEDNWRDLADAFALASAGAGGLVSAPGMADGYVIFYTGTTTAAGDNDFTYDRITSRVKLNGAIQLRDLGELQSTPTSGYGLLYVKNDLPYYLDDSGTEHALIEGTDLSGIIATVEDLKSEVRTDLKHLVVAADAYGDHVANTSNPHSVTPAQVGNTTAQWNADKLQSRIVDFQAPLDKQNLQWNATRQVWEPEYIAAGDIIGFFDFLDGYEPEPSAQEFKVQMGDAIQTILKDLDGYNTTISEHYRQHSDAIDYLRFAADAYGVNIDEHGIALDHLRQAADAYGVNIDEHYAQHSDAIFTIRKDLDGYAQTEAEHHIQHSDAIQAILNDLDGYNQTIQEHYFQHSNAFGTIRKDLDGYNQTISEHYKQHSDTIQTIVKELDGYIWRDAIQSSLIPDTDAAYDLGSESYRWRDLHLYQNGGINIHYDGEWIGTTRSEEQVTTNIGSFGVLYAAFHPNQTFGYFTDSNDETRRIDLLNNVVSIVDSSIISDVKSLWLDSDGTLLYVSGATDTGSYTNDKLYKVPPDLSGKTLVTTLNVLGSQGCWQTVKLNPQENVIGISKTSLSDLHTSSDPITLGERIWSWNPTSKTIGSQLYDSDRSFTQGYGWSYWEDACFTFNKDGTHYYRETYNNASITQVKISGGATSTFYTDPSPNYNIFGSNYVHLQTGQDGEVFVIRRQGSHLIERIVSGSVVVVDSTVQSKHTFNIGPAIGFRDVPNDPETLDTLFYYIENSDALYKTVFNEQNENRQWKFNVNDQTDDLRLINNFFSGTNERVLVITEVDGYVGIGVEQPNEALTVDGVISLANRSEFVKPDDGYGKLYVDASNNLYFKKSTGAEYNLLGTPSQIADGYVAFFTGGTGIAGDNDFYWDRVNNRLAIGVPGTPPRPQAQLHIGSSNPEIWLKSNEATANPRIRLLESGGDESYIQGAYLHYHGSTNKLHIGIHSTADANTGNDSNVISIDTSNRISLGGAPFSEKLSLVGAIAVGSHPGHPTGVPNTAKLYYKDGDHFLWKDEDNNSLMLANTRDLDGYASDQTVSEHYGHVSEAIDLLRQAADGYGQGLTEQENYTTQHSEAISTIIDELDGYATDEQWNAHSEAISTIIDELDGYATDEQWNAHSEAISTIIDELDGYATDEQWNAHSEAITEIRDRLDDGYASVSGNDSDGYVAFFTGANGIAGDNDLVFDRVNNRLVVSGFQLTTNPVNTYVLTTDGNGIGTWQEPEAVNFNAILTDDNLGQVLVDDNTGHVMTNN